MYNHGYANNTKEIMSTTTEEYLELQTQADMLSKIKMTACKDAFDYDEACNTQTNESWLVIPPTRYLDPKVQKYYESQFWAYLWDFRGEQK